MLARKAHTAPIEGVDLDAFALARARLAEGEGDATTISASLSLVDLTAWERVERGWLERVAESEHVAAVLDLLIEDRRAEIVAARRSVGGPSMGPVDPAEGEVPLAQRALPSFMREEQRAAPRPVAPQPPLAFGRASAPTAPLDPEHKPDLLAPGPIPFGGTTTPQRLAELRVEAPTAPLEPLPGADETAMVVPSAALRDIIAAPAHPFQPPGPAAPSRPSHAEPFVTAPLDLEHLGALRARGPTPFKGATTPERLAALKQEAAATAPPPSLDGAHTGTDETAMYMPSAAERAAFAPLPFTTPAAPAPAPPRELTLDELASLAAQLQVRPGSVEVLARFGIRTQAELLAVHADQERRFAADPTLRKLFEERRAHFLSFMKKEPRG